ncbi:MAG: hypothetical protein IJT37_02690 [Lachnospiraceae bacterium]|nr:hypothetical protein [Lachnospiraceae bacterium]
MEKRIRGGVNVGTSSVLISFMLLCMVCFSALTYVTARSDYALSMQTAQRTKEYYEANRMAELYMTNIEGLLSKHVKTCSDPDEFYSTIPDLFSDNDSITVIEEQNEDNPVFLNYIVPINDTLELHVSLKAHYPDSRDHTVFNIENWNTVSIRQGMTF